ncbi:MAG TPA: hypothetical protein VML19_32055 [Verrucomicrobiae bacterium]|nr:hypothetical protein [Verrucomicrobiae bacterium]
MTRLNTTLMAAAAFVVAAGIASAQTMEANIPFAFHAGGKALDAGTYRVRVERSEAGNSTMIVSGGHGKQLLTFLYPSGNAKAAWVSAGNAVLSFQCSEGRCTLANVWMGSEGETVYRVASPKTHGGAAVTTAEVVLHPVRNDGE